jgi:hypothetical protein
MSHSSTRDFVRRIIVLGGVDSLQKESPLETSRRSRHPTTSCKLLKAMRSFEKKRRGAGACVGSAKETEKRESPKRLVFRQASCASNLTEIQTWEKRFRLEETAPSP